MKVVLPTAQSMRNLCYSLAADYGSLTLEGREAGAGARGVGVTACMGA